MVLKRLALFFAVVVATVGSMPVSAHVIDPCAGTDHCNYWESPQGRCLRASIAEVSDGDAHHGYMRTLIQTKKLIGNGGYAAACEAAWYLISGKSKYQATVWKHTYVPKWEEWDDSICTVATLSAGWHANQQPAWQQSESHKYAHAPCGSGYYFSASRATIYDDTSSAWVGYQWAVSTDYHYWSY